jgi:hypothetical protein
MTIVEIYNLAGERVAIIKNLYPLNEAGMILQYSKELSDYGVCRFRVATSDPALIAYGDILVPHQYRIKVRRNNTVVWQGGIVDNSERNKNYIEVVGHSYLWYLSKVLIRRDEEINPGDSIKHLRVFDSGTLSNAVTNVFNQAIADLNAASPIGDATVGTIDNPNFPEIYDESGAWTFSTDFALQFDYHDALYVLKAFGIYGECDFELTDNFEFNFQEVIGRKLLKMTFEYGARGNIVDYNIPRLGSRMANDIVGIGVIDTGETLHTNQRDELSIQTYGKLQAPAAYTDVKNKSTLRQRIKEELRLVSKPDAAPINLVLNEKGYPLGQYDIGDVVKVKIKDHNIDFNDWRRIVGVTVSLHNTGRELVVIQTNKPTQKVLEA